MRLMKKTDLKTFDVVTYDLEIEFDKKMAPIKKKINTLNGRHEKKSLKAHKDFLAREKKSKTKLNDIDDLVVTRFQRIEKAVENKLIKLNAKDHSIKEHFEEYKKAQNIVYQDEVSIIKAEMEELQQDELNDLQKIKDKYSENVESYVEKLDTYNSNYENNREIFNKQYAEYTKMLEESIKEIEQIKEKNDQLVDEKLNEFIALKQDENASSTLKHQEFDKTRYNEMLAVRKESNTQKEEIDALIESLKDFYEDNYKVYIKSLQDKVKDIEQYFKDRVTLIDKDLDANISNVVKALEDADEEESKKLIKVVDTKKELFELRAQTVKEYELMMKDEHITVLQDQMNLFQQLLTNELLNLDKLAVFLHSDYDHLKNTGEHFKGLNLDLHGYLVELEIANNEFVIKQRKLRSEYYNNYTKLFNTLKQRMIEANQARIEQLSVINLELDEINKFLDTVEPLKEIELNKLRQSIEENEIKERYKIKYAKAEHEQKLAHNNYIQAVGLEEINYKTQLSENNRDITNVKNKETFDKTVEEAKKKYHKADEIYKLRLNSTKLERSILDSSYETELAKLDLMKELVTVEIDKKNALEKKEIDNNISNLELEHNYKLEVLEKSLEEDLLSLNDKLNKLQSERDEYTASINAIVNTEEKKVDKEVLVINQEFDKKLLLIDEALNREIKEPTLNIARSEVIIKERLAKFTSNNQTFEEFKEMQLGLLDDETLDINQIKQLIVKKQNIQDKAVKYLETAYNVLIEAKTFMFEIEEKSLLNELSSTADQTKIKRINKQLDKIRIDHKREQKEIKESLKDEQLTITAFIKGNLQRLEKQNNIEKDALYEQLDNILSMIYKKISVIQTNLNKEVKTIYKPLTINDELLLENARKSAIVAKERVEKEREIAISPINVKLGEFIKEKEDAKQAKLLTYDKEINEIKTIIDEKETLVHSRINDLKAEKDHFIEMKNSQLNAINDSQSMQIDEKLNEIISRKMKLESDYVELINQLEEKDLDAKKIFDYEERIYNIALEYAESRYNDTVTKTEQTHKIKVDDIVRDTQIINNTYEKNIERINKELVKATNEFEKNIFTVRPRLEESIGDAQKAIDEERIIKEKRKEELLDQIKIRTEAIENGLYTSFKETEEKLRDNLLYYLDKYDVIKEAYINKIHEVNEQIALNYENYNNALNKLGEEKITEVREDLTNLNLKIS